MALPSRCTGVTRQTTPSTYTACCRQTLFRKTSPARTLRHVCCASSGVEKPNALKYDHLLLTILDSNPYLGEGSKQAVAASAELMKQFNSKLTVLVVDEKPEEPEEQEKRITNISWHLKQQGCQDFEVVEKPVQTKSSVLIGDVADEISADLVLLSADIVHTKHVDANLLVEFVPCPVLLLP